MTETERFLEAMTARITEAEVAVHNGDAGKRIAMWSRTEPLTLFGAAMNGRSWAQIEPVFELLGEQFSNCVSYDNEIIAAEARGDLAYTVALEHTTVSIDGAPTSYVLRVTTIFRRERGDWKVVHRHGDPMAADVGADPTALAPLADLPAGPRRAGRTLP